MVFYEAVLNYIIEVNCQKSVLLVAVLIFAILTIHIEN